MRIIKRHWFLICLIPLLIALISISTYKYITINKYKNYSIYEQIKVVTSLLIDEEYKELSENELNIIFSKYKEIGYDLNKSDFATFGKVLFSLSNKYTFFDGIKEYLNNNNVEYLSQEEVYKQTGEVTVKDKMIITESYYSDYLLSVAIKHYESTHDYTQLKTDIEEFLLQNFPNMNEEDKEYYKEYLLSTEIINDLVADLKGQNQK